MTTVLDRSFYDVGHFVLCEVERALENAGRDPVSRSYVAAGSIAWDDCCGMLVVAPENLYRSVNFPAENAVEEFCYAGEMALNLLVLLVRCIPVVDDRGRAPTAKDLDEAYKRILMDAGVVWNAITCLDLPEDWERSSVRQTYMGAEGGCIGIETRLTLGLGHTNWRTK